MPIESLNLTLKIQFKKFSCLSNNNVAGWLWLGAGGSPSKDIRCSMRLADF